MVALQCQKSKFTRQYGGANILYYFSHDNINSQRFQIKIVLVLVHSMGTVTNNAIVVLGH